MWQVRQAELLKEEIETSLDCLAATGGGFLSLIKEPLTKAKRGLGDGVTDHQAWPLLPLIVCEAVSGRCDNALPAAASLQFFLAAGDVFDDIEDADSPESLSVGYGAVAINAATTLLILAEKAITRLKESNTEDRIIVRVVETFNSFYTTACAGQHLDLCLGAELSISEDVYLEIIEKKSASQVECACHIGALLANANQELIDLFSTFGHNLGMAAQIANDIRGVTQGRDISKRRITLPVIYTLAQMNGEAHRQLELAFGKCSVSSSQTTYIRGLLFRTGAIHYATVKMETYRQRARDILGEIRKSGVSIERIEPFVK